jgi:hypothetical protein
LSLTERKASQGKYRVIGEDRYSDEDYYVGEYETKEDAFEAANKQRNEALTVASDAVIADCYSVYDDEGKFLGQGYDFERISKAIDFATKAHGNQKRKGTTIPYIVHPIDVLSILLKDGADEDLAVAGVLHDVIEDTPHTSDEIADVFGEAVSRLVRDASIPKTIPWREGKQLKIDKTKSGSRELKLLLCADKLANIRDVRIEYQMIGDEVWKKFKRFYNSKEDQRWYYHSMIKALGAGKGDISAISDTKCYKELVVCFEEVFGKS